MKWRERERERWEREKIQSPGGRSSHVLSPSKRSKGAGREEKEGEGMWGSLLIMVFPTWSEPASHFTPSDGHQLLDTFYQVSDAPDTIWFFHQTSAGLRTTAKSCDIFWGGDSSWKICEEHLESVWFEGFWIGCSFLWTLGNKDAGLSLTMDVPGRFETLMSLSIFAEVFQFEDYYLILSLNDLPCGLLSSYTCCTLKLPESFYPQAVRLSNLSSALHHKIIFLCSIKGLQLANFCVQHSVIKWNMNELEKLKFVSLLFGFL